MRIFFALALMLAQTVWAQTSFRGYQKKSISQPYMIHERIVRFQKEPKDFYLCLTNHEALYRFPRSADLDQQVESFLKSRKAKSGLLKIEIDKLTGEIFFIGDLQSPISR